MLLSVNRPAFLTAICLCRNLLGLIRTNAELEEQERPLKDVCLNRVFLGNPGTGW
jgi:hypothetical protein